MLLRLPLAETPITKCQDEAMRMDHVSYACERDGLLATTERISAALGVDAVRGGVHPRFGTRNMIIPLADNKYTEVVEVWTTLLLTRHPLAGSPRTLGGWRRLDGLVRRR